jgi:hypothetical protein
MYTHCLTVAAACGPVPTDPISSVVYTIFSMKPYTKINIIQDVVLRQYTVVSIIAN